MSNRLLATALLTLFGVSIYWNLTIDRFIDQSIALDRQSQCGAVFGACIIHQLPNNLCMLLMEINRCEVPE